MATVTIALIQFNALAEAPEHNLGRMRDLARLAVSHGARWVLFHELTVSDYTPRLERFAEAIPEGPATQAMVALAAEQNCWLGFGLLEKRAEFYHGAQVFVGPAGYVYHYRKTYLWRADDDTGGRNEWARLEPGSGPQAFSFDGVRTACICAGGGLVPRCIRAVKAMQPQVVIWPNNVHRLPDPQVLGPKARAVGAPMLLINRVGQSGSVACLGGSSFVAADGNILAAANNHGEEEILIHEVEL